MKITRRHGLAAGLATSVGLALGKPARAEAKTLRFAKQYGLPHLTLMIAERLRLVEKAAAAAGLGDVSVEWRTFAGASGITDALLSKAVDFASVGVPTLALLWDRTAGTAFPISGVVALQSAPAALVTRNEKVRTIADLSDRDRIALPAVKLTAQAIILQMAAAKQWGIENYARLDPLTISRSHPDAMIALLSGNSEITCHFTVAPFYQAEVADPSVRRILHSYDVLGGKHTNSLLLGPNAFIEQNPILTTAMVKAFEQVNDVIRHNPREAAAIYKDMTGDKRSSEEQLESLIKDPEVEYTTAPVNIGPFVDFMHLAKTIKRKPERLSQMFALPGLLPPSL